MFFHEKSKLPYMSVSVIEDITEAQNKGEDAIYHGKCISCIFRKGNAEREGILFCTGCRWFQLDARYEDLCVDKIDR